MQVESEDQFERIGGSSIGGGTFWGLGALLTQTKVFMVVPSLVLICLTIARSAGLKQSLILF